MKKRTRHLALVTAVICATNVALAQGTDTTQVDHRIVGGVNFDINAAPATVALLSNNRLAQTGSYFQAQFCGGTVIGSRWVVTAAHCISSDNGVTPASEISVLMGTSDLNVPVNQPVGVTRVIPHSGYRPSSTANDIALLQLEYDALVTPAALDTRPVSLNDEALITGWGALNEGSETENQRFPSILQGALVSMIPSDQCGTRFPLYAGRVDSRNLCAGIPAGGVDSCQGDSGGPLYRFDPASTVTSVLTGVVSWGFGCADPSAPGVYTRVAAFSDWLNGTTGTGLTGPIQQDDPLQGQTPVSTTSSGENPGISSTNGVSQFSASAGTSGFWWLIVTGGLAIVRRALYRTRSEGAEIIRHSPDNC